MSTDYTARAQRCLDGVSGDRISAEMTPTVVAELLEAQVHATLAVAAAINNLADATTEAANAGAKAIYDGRV